MTFTLGPVGRVAHPADTNDTRSNMDFIVCLNMAHSSGPDGAGAGTTFIQPLGHCLT